MRRLPGKGLGSGGRAGRPHDAAASSDGIRIWDIAAAAVVAMIVYEDDPQVTGGLGYSPDGRLLASGQSGATWSSGRSRHGKRWAILRGHREEISSLAFAPDGRTVTTGSWDATVRSWDLAPRLNESIPATPKGDTRQPPSSRPAPGLAGSDRGPRVMVRLARQGETPGSFTPILTRADRFPNWGPTRSRQSPILPTGSECSGGARHETRPL